MLDFSPIQILLVLAVGLLVFGGRRLPEAARGLGSGIREFTLAVRARGVDETTDATPGDRS